MGKFMHRWPLTLHLVELFRQGRAGRRGSPAITSTEASEGLASEDDVQSMSSTLLYSTVLYCTVLYSMEGKTHPNTAAVVLFVALRL